MRSSFLVFLAAITVAAGLFATSAFNQADLAPRTVIATVVTDANGYLAVATSDTEYACYVDADTGGTGKISINWDGGTSCTAGATGTGVNPDAVYYFHDVLVITNKGTKTLTHLYLNMTGSAITLNTNAAASTMLRSESYNAEKLMTTNLAPGNSWYVGFRIETTGLSSGATISETLSIEAHSSD